MDDPWFLRPDLWALLPRAKPTTHAQDAGAEGCGKRYRSDSISVLISVLKPLSFWRMSSIFLIE
jgi:hypothetical protein